MAGALALHKAEELLAFFADSQEDESAPLEHPSVDRRFPPKRRRPAGASGRTCRRRS